MKQVKKEELATDCFYFTHTHKFAPLTEKALKRLPGDGNVDLLPGHGVADGPCKDPGLVSGKVLGVRVSVQVPGHHVGLDAGDVHLSNVLCIC